MRRCGRGNPRKKTAPAQLCRGGLGFARCGSVDGQHRALIGGVDELLNFIGVQGIHQSHDGGVILMTGLDGDDVALGLGGIGVGVL